MICREAESLEQIEELFIKYSKEYLNVELKFDKFSFQFVQSVSDNKPGFVGDISGTVKYCSNSRNYSKNREITAGDFFKIHASSINEFVDAFPRKPKKENVGIMFKTNLEYHFHGLHTCTGCSGSNFRMSCNIFLHDFPKIKEKYDQFCIEQKEKLAYDSLKKELTDHCDDAVFYRLKQNIELQNLISEQEKMDERRKEIYTLIEQIRILAKNDTKPMLEEIDKALKVNLKFNKKKYDSLKTIFCKRFD